MKSPTTLIKGGLLAASRANAPDLPFSVSLRINSAGRIFVDRLARH